ncbi:hypothetical protein ACIQC7_27785 [Kitasatospora sp. NPDC088556]|uniref:hypothetical protein n=1 Tax=Kitasatospora sp. NPDC088556 TaxID=3364076 RepID=UPI003815C2F7
MTDQPTCLAGPDPLDELVTAAQQIRAGDPRLGPDLREPVAVLLDEAATMIRSLTWNDPDHEVLHRALAVARAVLGQNGGQQ